MCFLHGVGEKIMSIVLFLALAGFFLGIGANIRLDDVEKKIK